MRTDRVHTFFARVVKVTDKAILVVADENEDAFWVPKSQILEPDADTLQVGVAEEITIPYWIAQEKGVV